MTDPSASPGHASGCPAHGPVLAGEGQSDYERYMRVPELLALQKEKDEQVHPDELMFQSVHQTFEIWMKLVLHEMDLVAEHLRGDRWIESLPHIERCTAIIRLNTEALHVLETMNPMDFHVIRAALGQGSGAESPGFRNVLQMGPRFWPTVTAALDRRDVDMKMVYVDRQPADVLRILEALTDLDMFFHIWRLNHLAMVKRVIGRDVKSLKGYAVHQLEEDVQHVLWPDLWRLRNELTEIAGTSPL